MIKIGKIYIYSEKPTLNDSCAMVCDVCAHGMPTVLDELRLLV